MRLANRIRLLALRKVITTPRTQVKLERQQFVRAARLSRSGQLVRWCGCG